MFPDNSYRCVKQHPQNKAEPSWFCLSFPVEIMKRLLDRFSKLCPEPLWVQAKECFVNSGNVDRHMDLVAVWNADETRPLVDEESGKPHDKCGQKKGHNDQVNRMRKQAASLAQLAGDGPTGNHTRRDGE